MDKRDKGYTLYKKGLSCTEISKKLDVSINTVKSWRKRYWTQGADAPAKRTLHPEDAPAAPDPETRPKQGAPPGNVNAVGAGAPKGNRNAVKHGGWSELMFRSWTEEHRQLLDACDEDVDVHPTHTAAASGLYKTTVDEEGHVTATTPVTKDDITKLGIPAQDTTYDEATTAKAGLMSAADKTKLDGMGATINKAIADHTATDAEVSEMLAEVYGE